MIDAARYIRVSAGRGSAEYRFGLPGHRWRGLCRATHVLTSFRNKGATQPQPSLSESVSHIRFPSIRLKGRQAALLANREMAY